MALELHAISAAIALANGPARGRHDSGGVSDV
jgi:hypothetical protein